MVLVKAAANMVNQSPVLQTVDQLKHKLLILFRASLWLVNWLSLFIKLLPSGEVRWYILIQILRSNLIAGEQQKDTTLAGTMRLSHLIKASSNVT